jgi:hypothetical protein
MAVPTVVIMPKKNSTARATAENASSKKGRSDHVLHIDAGYTYPEQCIDELLELAGADTSPQSRRDLVNALQLAQLAYDDERERASRERPPPKQIEQFENSIEKTLTLLRSIRKYKDWRNVGFMTQPVGRGVVDFATTQEMIRGRVQELPRHPSISDQELILPRCDGMGAAINIEPLLRATLLAVRRRRSRRGAPKKVGKEAVVSYAADYFRKHSPKEPSTDPANPFHPFVERFYEVVTKTKPSGFDRQMRKIFRANRSGH